MSQLAFAPHSDLNKKNDGEKKREAGTERNQWKKHDEIDARIANFTIRFNVKHTKIDKREYS